MLPKFTSALGVFLAGALALSTAFPRPAVALSPSEQQQSTPPPTQQPPQTTPAPQTAPSKPTLDPQAYRIGPEDVLAVAILEAPDLNKTVQVTPSGDISLALVGTIRVSGLTSSEIEAAIAARLREKYIKNPNVTVQVTEARSHTVTVTGAVRKPGVFQVRSSKSLLEVLSLAEGLADDAGERALIVRGGAPDAPITEVKLKALHDNPDANSNVVVQPGDAVTVTRQGVVYVVGDVKKPGAFPMRSGKSTVLNAIAESEGLAPTAMLSKAMILRPNDSGDRDMLPLDLGRMMRGKDPDVPLLPEDVLFVPQSGAKVVGRATADVALRLLFWRIPIGGR